MKKNVFIMLRRLYVAALTAVMATLAVVAQTSGAGDDRIAQLEKEMYRYFGSSAIDSFMLITDQLILNLLMYVIKMLPLSLTASLEASVLYTPSQAKMTRSTTIFIPVQRAIIW